MYIDNHSMRARLEAKCGAMPKRETYLPVCVRMHSKQSCGQVSMAHVASGVFSFCAPLILLIHFLFHSCIETCGSIAKQKPGALLSVSVDFVLCFIPNTEACRTALLATQRYRSRCILHILFLALHFSIFFLSFLISHYRFLVLLIFILMVSVKQNLGSLSIQESDCMASGDFEQQ